MDTDNGNRILPFQLPSSRLLERVFRAFRMFYRHPWVPNNCYKRQCTQTGNSMNFPPKCRLLVRPTYERLIVNMEEKELIPC